MADDENDALQHARVAGVATRMRLDAATAEVLRIFAAAGVETALLKGASLIGWLYPGDSAHYTDADILIRPGDAEPAARVLSGLGFERALDDRAMPGWWLEHATEWHREADGVAVDLHRHLVGVGAEPELAWELLSQDRETKLVGGHPAPVLAPRARLVHVVLHAAQDGAGRGGKAMLHLERALELVPEDTWRAAARLAGELDATDPFAAGLRLTPEGVAMADRLGVPAVASVDAALRATAPPPVALGFEQLARARGVRARAVIVWRKLFPPRAFIVHWDPRAGEGGTRLALAYLRRPLWLLRSAPRGFRAWWRARHDVRGR